MHKSRHSIFAVLLGVLNTLATGLATPACRAHPPPSAIHGTPFGSGSVKLEYWVFHLGETEEGISSITTITQLEAQRILALIGPGTSISSPRYSAWPRQTTENGQLLDISVTRCADARDERDAKIKLRQVMQWVQSKMKA